MKNTIKISLLCLVLIIAAFAVPVISNAANDGYSIDIQYTGDVLVGEEKDATAILAGVDAKVYTNVRLKVDVKGPAKPVLLATDSKNNEIDIAKEGYWGPAGGFTVGATFTNKTPIKATFPKAGTYTITISLVDVKNSEAVIVSKATNIKVGFNVTTVVDGKEEKIYVSEGATFESLGLKEPVKEGYTFEGWYLDSNYETSVEPTTKMTDTTKLYAKFAIVEDKEEVTPPTEEEKEETTPPAEKAEEEKDETPKTGVESYVGIAISIIAISSIAVITLKNRK